MRINPSIYILIALFSIGTIFVITTDNAGAGFTIPPVCCINPETDTCVGCESGCSTLPSFCEENGGIVEGEFLVCRDIEPGSTFCGRVIPDSTGCCVFSQGQCADDLEQEECLSNEDGQVWAVDQSCDTQTLCEPLQRSVPALSQWGIIAVALLLGIVGFIVVRKKKNIVQ